VSLSCRTRRNGIRLHFRNFSVGSAGALHVKSVYFSSIAPIVSERSSLSTKRWIQNLSSMTQAVALLFLGDAEMNYWRTHSERPEMNV
jgi:hypothetical protein